jgi:hypothetical protein
MKTSVNLFLFFSLVFALIFLSSCTHRQNKTDLPNYSDMSAAADAGRTPSAVIITNDN